MYTHVYKHDPAVIGYKLGLILLNTSMYLLMLLLNFLSAKPRRRLQYRKRVGASVQACNKHLQVQASAQLLTSNLSEYSGA